MCVSLLKLLRVNVQVQKISILPPPPNRTDWNFLGVSVGEGVFQTKKLKEMCEA